MDRKAHTGFRDRRIQPLCHLSGGAGLKVVEGGGRGAGSLGLHANRRPPPTGGPAPDAQRPVLPDRAISGIKRGGNPQGRIFPAGRCCIHLGGCEVHTTARRGMAKVGTIRGRLVEKRALCVGTFLDQALPRWSTPCELATTNRRAPGFVHQRLESKNPELAATRGPNGGIFPIGITRVGRMRHRDASVT